MAVSKGLPVNEQRRCAAEMESMVWAMIVLLLALIAGAAVLFWGSVGA